MEQDKATPRPWRWQDFGSGPILVSEAPSVPIVMDFVRREESGK